MGRPNNPDLTRYWKICLPATLAGTVELYLMDTIHKKPQYGARAKLISELLEDWIKTRRDPDFPTREKIIGSLREIASISQSNPTFAAEAATRLADKLENPRA